MGYIALSLGDAGRTLEGLHARVRIATLGESFPAYLRPFRAPWQLTAWGLSTSAAEERGLCVAVLPLLAKDMTLEVEDATGRGLAHAAFDSLSSKLHSRLLTGRCAQKDPYRCPGCTSPLGERHLLRHARHSRMALASDTPYGRRTF